MKYDMEPKDITFFDFGGEAKSHSSIRNHEINVFLTETNHDITFNIFDSETILKGGFTRVRIARINLTGEILIVFNNDNGFTFSKPSSNSKNVRLRKKGVSQFIIQQVTKQSANGKYTFQISENVSNSDEYLTYKIIKRVI